MRSPNQFTPAMEPTSFVKKFGSEIAKAAGDYPVLDVACGTGRNGIFLAQLGSNVVFLDEDISRLPVDRTGLGHLTKLRIDLIADPWPFKEATVGGVVLIDFLHLPLIPRFRESLITGGIFLLETVSGRGENYRELPHAGELLNAVRDGFKIEFYKESPVGPDLLRRVSVKMLARRVIKAA